MIVARIAFQKIMLLTKPFRVILLETFRLADIITLGVIDANFL